MSRHTSWDMGGTFAGSKKVPLSPGGCCADRTCGWPGREQAVSQYPIPLPLSQGLSCSVETGKPHIGALSMDFLLMYSWG